MGRANVVVVTGTGTGIGKTHVAVALLDAWGRTRRVIGYKPVETGVPRGERGEDAERLAAASTFDAADPVFRQTFPWPISPHLAARRARAHIQIVRLARQAARLSNEAEGVVVELAGGLFSPLSARATQADFARVLRPSKLILVAPDRLGVLHDLGATLRAARIEGLTVSGVVLSAPHDRDASTGTNYAEIRRIIGAEVLAEFPRAPAGARSTKRAAESLVQALDLA